MTLSKHITLYTVIKMWMLSSSMYMWRPILIHCKKKVNFSLCIARILSIFMMDDNLFISGKRAIFQDTNPDTQGGLSLDQKDQYPSLGVLA